MRGGQTLFNPLQCGTPSPSRIGGRLAFRFLDQRLARYPAGTASSAARAVLTTAIARERVRELQAQAVCGAGPPSHLQRLHDGKQLRRSLRGGSGRERQTVQANVIRYDSPARGRMRSVLLPGLSSVAAGRRSAATSHRTRCHRYCCDSNSPVGSTGGVDLITCAEAPGQVRAFRAPTGSPVGAPKFAL